MAYATGFVTASNGFGIELARVTETASAPPTSPPSAAATQCPSRRAPEPPSRHGTPPPTSAVQQPSQSPLPGEIITLDIAIVPVSPTVVDVFPQHEDQPVNVSAHH